MTDQVRVRFVTEHAVFRVTDTAFAIPAKLGRRGLSEVVNHLLDRTANPQPFDFSINDTLVRESIATFLASRHMTTESIVEIRYFPAVTLSSDSVKEQELPAWVGTMDTSSDTLLAGCYDGKYQLLDSETLGLGSGSGAPIGAGNAHTAPIRVIRRMNSSFFATGSKDHSVKIWREETVTGGNGNGKNSSKKVSAIPIALGDAHLNSVEAMDFLSSKDMLFSADWSGNLMCWTTGDLLASGGGTGSGSDGANEDGSNAKGKRKRDGNGSGSGSEIREMRPLFSVKAHTQCISQVLALGAEDNTILTASHDHTVKAWDVERQDCKQTIACNKVITSASAAPSSSSSAASSSSLIATSHCDGVVRMWDMRLAQRGETASVSSLGKSGTGAWVSAVKWHPADATKLGSADYMGVVRLWDLRSNKPLGEVQAHDGKALCLDWHVASDTLFSGGSDCFVKATPIHSVSISNQ
jgi:ribosome biogenesis protein